MKLIRERLHLLISLLFTVLIFAFIISNFPFASDLRPDREPIADASVGKEQE